MRLFKGGSHPLGRNLGKLWVLRQQDRNQEVWEGTPAFLWVVFSWAGLGGVWTCLRGRLGGRKGAEDG